MGQMGPFLAPKMFASKNNHSRRMTSASDPHYITNIKGETWYLDDAGVRDLPTKLGLHTSTRVVVDGRPYVYMIGGCQDRMDHVPEAAAADVGWPWKCPHFHAPVLRYDPAEDRYATLADIPISRYGHAAVEVDGKIWIAGGRAGKLWKPVDEVHLDKIIYDIHVYDIAEESWTTVLNFDMATANGAAFALDDGSFYYVGGFDEEYNPTAEMYRIDCAESLATGSVKYERVASLNNARGHVDAAVLDGSAVVAGGTVDGFYCEALGTVETYSKMEDRWSYLEQLDDGGGSIALIVFQNQLLAFGGVHNSECKRDFAGLADVSALDPTRQTSPVWYQHGVLPESRLLYSVVASPESDAVLVFGGMGYYDEDCDCMHMTNLASKYHLADPESLMAMRNTLLWSKFTMLIIIASVGLSIVVLLVAYSLVKKKLVKKSEAPPVTLFNPEAASSLPTSRNEVDAAL